MKVIRLSGTKRFQNSPTCVAIEYPFGDKDLNLALIVLTGRYPDKGFLVNHVCKELAYVLEGSGQLVSRSETISLGQGDTALLLPHEEYFWEGSMKLVVPCSPAFSAGQHEAIPE